VLAPGEGVDPIHCFRLVIDLDADWKLHDRAGQSWLCLDQKRATYIKAKIPEVELVQGFKVPTLRFQPGNGRGLRPFQRYTALPYVRGNQNSLHKIFLNGKPFYVEHSLYMALQRLRRQMAILGLFATSPASVHPKSLKPWNTACYRKVACCG
jgi:hypothetical protein